MPWNFSLREDPMMTAHAVDRAAYLRNNTEALEEGWPTALVLRLDPRGRFRTDVVETPEEVVTVQKVHYTNTPGGAGDIDGDLAETSDELAGRHLQLVFDPAFDIAERPPNQAVFLGLGLDGRHIWGLQSDSLGSAVTDLRSAGEFLMPHDAAIAAEAVALLAWHRSQTFVATEHPMQRGHAGWAGTDPAGTELEFPRTDPAIICLVHDGDRQMLLARNANWTDNFYSVLAGFVEAGESLENCARREIREEVGLDIENLRYLGSQPWPFPRSLMVGFHAVADPTRELIAADGEIAHAMWLDVEEVKRALQGRNPKVILPGRISIARLMIESWVASVDAEFGGPGLEA